MIEIENTPLYENGHKNFLVPCLVNNDKSQLLKLGKHSHKIVTFVCTKCSRRLKSRIDSINHVRRNPYNGCGFCRTDSRNSHEQTLSSLVYDYVSQIHPGKEHNYVENQKILSGRLRADVFIRKSDVLKDVLIELDDSSHLTSINTICSDKLKHELAKKNGYLVLRIRLDKKDTFTDELKQSIKESLESMRNGEITELVTILNDNDNKLRQKFNL
jgi:very-short-patch-repair endonuclease